MCVRHLLENRWAENNVQYDSNEQKIYYMWNYITCGISICILAHSFILHGRKYDSVRTCTDLACILGIIPAFSTAAASVHPDLLKTVIVNQIINYSFCGLLLKACDMQMFLSRYCVIQRLSLQQQKVRYVRMGVVYVGYVLIWTVSPCWLDANSTSFYPRIVFLSIEGVVAVIFISYILFFTWMSVRVILSLSRWERRQNPHLDTGAGLTTLKADSAVAAVGCYTYIGHITRIMGSSLCLWGARGCVGSSAKCQPLNIEEDAIIRNIPGLGKNELLQLLRTTTKKNRVANEPLPPEPQQESTPVTSGKNEAIIAVLGNTQESDGEDIGSSLQSAVWRWRLKVVAYKSVLHAIISIAGLVMIITSPETFNYTLGMQTVVALHFLFNWRIEDVIWPVQSSGVSKGRASREYHAFKQLRKGDRVERIESAAVIYNGGTGAVAAVADRCMRHIKKARESLFITLQVEIMCRRGGLLGGGGGHLSAVAPLPSNERKVVDECVEGGNSNARGNEAGKIAGEMKRRLAGVRSPPAVDGGEGGGEGPRYPHHVNEDEGKSWDQSLIRDCDRRILL